MATRGTQALLARLNRLNRTAVLNRVALLNHAAVLNRLIDRCVAGSAHHDRLAARTKSPTPT